MKVCVLFVLVLCAHSSFQQLNRKQPDPSSLSYAEAEFSPLPPKTPTTVAPELTTKKKGFFSGLFGSKDKETKTTTEAPTTTTTTTAAPEATTKKKGFFSGLFGSKDKETTTTEAPTTKKPVTSSTTTTTTAKSVPASPSTVKSAPIPPSTPRPVVQSSRVDVPVSSSTPKVPPRAQSPTPPSRPPVQQPTSSTPAPKTTKDDFPPLPGQSGQQPSPTVPNAWGTPSTQKPGAAVPNAWGTPSTQKPGAAPNAWGTPPTQKPLATPNAWGTPPPSGPTQKPLATPNAWGTPPPSGPTQKPQSFFPQPPPTRKSPPATPTTVDSGPATDSELLTLSESLFSKDIHNPFKFVTVNYQGKNQYGSTADQAAQSLLSIDEKLWSVSTVEKMKAMYNNYEQDTAINEYVSPIERKEEDEFIDAVLTTPVMRHAMNFLTQKGVVTADPQTHRELLRTIWFGLYSRGMGKIGSSGFEHVFLSEVKNGTVMGLHNWIYLSEVEKSGDLDYKGWSKKIDLGNKGQIAKIRFSLNNLDKPSNSLFIGTSPELELALYTVCFELRADKDCRLAYGGKDFNIVTHSYKYRGKNMIGSAYPEI